MTPMGIPNVVLALAVFLTYVMTPIHGSIWVLIMAHIVAHLPFTTRVLSAALLQQHKELEEAARSHRRDDRPRGPDRDTAAALSGVAKRLALGVFRDFARFYFRDFSDDWA